MRVPIEIFDDVKKFMERRKQTYLAESQGIELSEDQLPYTGEFSLGSSDHKIEELIRETIRAEISTIKGEIGAADRVEIPPPDLNTKDRVLQLLEQKPGVEMTTTAIADLLDLPGSTARQATRELAEEMDTISKISGRPNKFRYDP